MSITLIVLITEIVLVLFGLVCFLFYLRWKRQKIKTTEFESLLTNFDKQVDERKAQLTEMLEKSYTLEVKEAEESANYMIEAEKQFLQQFLAQQLEQKPVNDFYQNLCELLDQYLYFIPTLSDDRSNKSIVNIDVQDEVEAENLDKELDSAELKDNSTDEVKTIGLDKADSENLTDSDETESTEDVPAASDDLSTKQDAINENTVEDSERNKVESSDSSEPGTLKDEIKPKSGAEPDLEGALAESEDEVDNTTEAAYETEKNTNID